MSRVGLEPTMPASQEWGLNPSPSTSLATDSQDAPGWIRTSSARLAGTGFDSVAFNHSATDANARQ